VQPPFPGLLLGQYVFDIFFMWMQRRYSEFKKRKRGMTPEQYEIWKAKYKERFGVLRVSRKYAKFESVSSGLKEDGIVDITCPMHNKYDCGKCQLGINVDPIIAQLHGFSTFSPEVSCLISFLVNEKFLTPEEITGIVNDAIVLYREEHLLHYLFMFMRKKQNMKLPGNIIYIFKKYRKYLLYWFLSYRSVYGMYRAQSPPVWCDFVMRDPYRVYREPSGTYINNLTSDFRRYNDMLRYDFNTRQYVRSQVSELLFPNMQYVTQTMDGDSITLSQGVPMIGGYYDEDEEDDDSSMTENGD